MEQNFTQLLKGIITGCLFAMIVLSLTSKVGAQEIPEASAFTQQLSLNSFYQPARHQAKQPILPYAR